ncbi:Retrovirus-related Pol poly, partial [Paramuricea clavata]
IYYTWKRVAVKVKDFLRMECMGFSTFWFDSHNKKQRTGQDKSCYRCGKLGHFEKDPSCPAKGKVCRKCGLKDHFEAQCKTTPKEEKGNNVSRHQQRRRAVNVINPEEEYPAYAFIVGSTKPEKVEVTVGGCQLNMIIDSGASVNIVDKQTWEWLKKNRVVCTSSRSEKKLYTYASQTPLEIIETFNCKISVGHHVVDAEVCIISGRGESLLGKDTAMKLGVLNMRKYPEVFKGVGKLEGRTVQLYINSDVKPVAQPVRRIPFNMRPKVEEKIKQLISLDIIEPVEGPTSWNHGSVKYFHPEWRQARLDSCTEEKRRLSSSTTLRYFDKDAPTQVVADASPVGLGAVLTQTHKDGPRVISYASPSLNRKEILADREGGLGFGMGLREVPPVCIWDFV